MANEKSDQNLLSFNGINGATGDYSFAGGYRAKFR